jgi:parallel beta-helix repeat protein
MNKKTCLLVLVIFFALSLSAYPSKLIVNVAAPLGIDDTAAVQIALTQCVAHGPGCTVQLAAGTYKTQQLFAGNFHGTFKGKGMDVTIIQALPLKGNPDKPYSSNAPSVGNPYPNLVTFLEGDIVVSDMTLKVVDPTPIPGGWWDPAGNFYTTLIFALLDFRGESKMNVVVERVGLDGKIDDKFDTNLITGPKFEPYPLASQLPGTFRISSCRLINSIIGIWVNYLRDARVTIGGSPSAGNFIANVIAAGYLVDLSNSKVEFSHNNSSCGGAPWACFSAQQEPSVELPTSYLIDHNSFKATGSLEDGIWIVDLGPPFGTGKKADTVISNNTIVLEPPTYAGIETVFTEGTKIFNNRITGSGLYGISIEGSTKCNLILNNVNGVTADVAPIALLTVPSAFDGTTPVPTTDSLVVGSGGKANVLDEGINNKIVGLNLMHCDGPGKDIRDLMKHKMEGFRSQHKH